jgi:hypothetical protein
MKDRNFRAAVQAAIRAYEKSGRMLDAALAYAAKGFPVFPVTVNKKTPVPPRDKDANRNPIPGTGSFKKATCDPIQIRKWWTGHEYLIGLPMGRVSGLWCLDVDTSEDHADGVARWGEVAAEHEPIVTREHRSATGGPHLIFNWTEEQPLGCSSGDLPDGISVKGQGGYIVAPPSRRKGRSYTVHSDIDPVDAPRWLLDKILQGGRPPQTSYSSDPVAANFDELAEALSFIPNTTRIGRSGRPWRCASSPPLAVKASICSTSGRERRSNMMPRSRSSAGKKSPTARRAAPAPKRFSRWRESTDGCRGCGRHLRPTTWSFARPTTHAVQCAHSLAISYTTSPTQTRTCLPRTGSSL